MSLLRSASDLLVAPYWLQLTFCCEAYGADSEVLANKREQLARRPAFEPFYKHMPVSSSALPSPVRARPCALHFGGHQ